MKRLLTAIGLLGALAVGAFYAVTGNLALGATSFPAVGAGEGQAIVLTLNRQYTATTTNVVKFALPYKAKLLGVSATARASGGTTPTLTVDVMEGGVTVLSAPVAITAGTVAEATITDAQLADEAVVTVNLAIGGGSPTWDDITVTLTVVRN
jgi:hypothetical protein